MSFTVGDFLVQRLNEWGIPRIYGFPGDEINGGVIGRAGDKMDYVQVRHEKCPLLWPAHIPRSAWPGLFAGIIRYRQKRFLPDDPCATLPPPSEGLMAAYLCVIP
jgi:hypothetical protein